MPTPQDAHEIRLLPEGEGVLRSLLDIVEDLTADWDTGRSAPVDIETLLVADLGFTSIDLVALVAAIDERWERRDWPFEQLLMTNGRYVDDLRVGDVAAFLVREGAR